MTTGTKDRLKKVIPRAVATALILTLLLGLWSRSPGTGQVAVSEVSVWDNSVVRSIAIVLGTILGLILILIIPLAISQVSKKSGQSPKGNVFSGYWRKYRGETTFLFILTLLIVCFFFPAWTEAWNLERAGGWYLVFSLPLLYLLFLGLRRWGTVILVGIIASLLIAHILPDQTVDDWVKELRRQQQTTQEAKAKEAATASLKPTGRSGRVTVTVPREPEWSKTVTIPLQCWFHIISPEKILVKNKKGVTKPAGPGYESDWWGDFIADRTFQFQAINSETVDVTVTWEPK